MKIYQIHEYGGEWEDRYDYIVGSYLSQEKAIAEKERLEKEFKELNKCDKCPLYYCEKECKYNDCDECIKHSIDDVITYCDRYKPSEYTKCTNYSIRLYDSYFKIVEVIVIE